MKTIPKQLCIIILKLLWLIFQTFDNEIDDTLHKIGILGNSFGTIIDIIVDRKKKIDDLIKENPGISESEAKQQVGSLWSYLNPKKEMSPELLDQAKRFGEIFNTTQLSASAVAEQMGKVDDSIIRCASSMKNGEFTLKAYTQSVQGLTFAAKAGKVALQLLASAGSMIAGILIGEAISGVIKLIDNQIHAAEKAQEAMEDSMAAYEKSKEELKNVNKELESNEKRIDELLAKDYLTYTEESELQRLKDVNEQLLIQRALLDEITENGLTQTIEKAVDGYNEKYKNGPVTNEDIDRYKRSVDGGMPLNELLVDENNIAKQIAAYEKLIEYRDKAFSSGDNKLAEKYSRQITDVNEHILTSLQEDQSKIKNLSLKPFDDLTSEAQEAFKGLSSSFEVAYKRFDPSTWNKIQLDDLFKTKEFDETKDNLSELSKAGKLTVESLSEEFPELAQAISNLDLVTSDGVSKLQSVVNQFNSESEKLKDSNVSSDPIGFDISNKETSKAIDEFQKKLSTLGSALENLKSRKLTSSDILDLQQEFPELANETDNLDKALTDLVNNTLSNLVTYLKDAGASDGLINTFRELANEAKGISTPDWSGTLSVFDTAQSKMQTLAEIVDALGKSYTLTAEEARKFAEVFPDLLQKGQVTSDGLIQFNKSVIDDFINGKQIQINADRETQISQLESEKALLEGKRAAAQAALDLIAAQASGEVDGENQKNEKIAEARDRLVQHLVDLGVEEQNADAVAKELMAGNMSEYDRVVSEVSANIDSNLTNSIDDASKNVNIQAGNMIDSLFKVGQQALNTAKSILSIGSENPVDTVKETLNGVGDSIKNFSPKDAASNFVKSVQDAINVNKYDSVDASVDLELDISNYTNAINELDSQINLLKSAGNKNVDDFVKDLRGNDKKGEDKPDKDNTKDIDWIERKIKLMEEERSKLEEMASSDTLSYLGINPEDSAKAQEIIQKMNGDTAITTEEFQLLGDMARNAGMSINAFIDAVKNGGSESRKSALESLLQRSQVDLEEYSKTAEKYKQDYENALSQLPEGYREKIEGGADINNLGIETLPDKEAEKVQKVIDLYDKWQNAESNVSNAKKEIFSTEKEVYENEIESLQKRGDALENQNNLITKQVDYLNATGQNISATSYETLIANLKQQQSFLDQQLALKKQELQRLLELDPNFKNSPEYYALQESIQSAEESLIDLDTQQAEYYDTLRQLPVQNMQKLVDMYDSITTALQNWGNEIEAQGKTLDESYYQALIDNGAETINQLREQADAVRDVMDEYEVGSDKWTEMYSKLQDINSSISGIVTNMHEWNQAILQIPLDRLSSLTENLEMVKDALSAVNEEQQTVVNSVTSVIDKQRESLEEAQKAEEQAIQDKIDALQDQMDLLDKQNEALELQIQKEQALKDLEDAKNQKKIRTIRDGKIVYEADKDAIADAQDKVQDANDAINRHELEEQQEKLQDELEAIGKKYDELYEKLDKISDKWSKIPTDIEDAQNKELADRWLGEGWEDKVLNGTDEEIYEYFKQQFEQNSQQMDQYEDQIHASEQIQALVNTYLTAYRNGTITRDQAMTGIKGVLGTINSELTAGQNIQNILTYLSTQNNTGATTNDILTDTQNKMMETANQIMQSLDVYEQNSNTITGYMSSFGELTEHISDIRDTIYDVEDELDDNFDDLKDTLEDGFDDMVDALGEYRSRKDDDDDERPDKGGESHSTNKEPIYSGGSGGGSNSHWDDSDSGHGPGVRSVSAVSMFSLNNDSEYIPITQETYDKLFKPYEGIKLSTTSQRIPGFTRTLTSLYSPSTNSKQQNVTINMGDIKLEGVQDPDGFAKAIKTHLPSSIRQQLSKR